MRLACKILCVAALSLLLGPRATPCNSFGLFMLYPLVVFDPDTYRGHDGSGFTHPIILRGPKGEKAAMDAENAYIMKKFMNDVETSQPVRRAVQLVGQSTFHIVTFATKGGKQRTLYFDATETLAPPANPSP